jgi:glycolate oxidase
MRKVLPAGFVDDMLKIVGDGFAIVDEETLARHSHDETPNLAPSLPDMVVRPGTVEEVQAIMRRCAEKGVYVTPRGAGSGKSGGCVPVYGGVVLALDRLHTITEIDREDQIARLQPFQEGSRPRGCSTRSTRRRCRGAPSAAMSPATPAGPAR